MEELEKKVVLKNGAVLLRHYIEEDENSLTITFVFDRPVQKEELTELREINSYSVIANALARKGWTTDGPDPTALIPHNMRIGYGEERKEWKIQFYRDREEVGDRGTLH